MATLRGLYRGEKGGQLGTLQNHWDRPAPPFGMLAGEYNTTGLFELATMLRLALRHGALSTGCCNGPPGGSQ